MNLVETLQAAGEDFEWYPTTDEILRTVSDDLLKWDDDRYGNSGVTIMDVGAGDGRALHKLRNMVAGEHSWDGITFGAMYAIEKSQIHIHHMPKDIIVIGCDFHEQMLVDKRVDVLFCNPPYSEYEHWMQRILTETNVGRIYLVVPRRWRDSAVLKEADDRFRDDEPGEILQSFQGIDVHGVRVKSLGAFDFEQAERKARARVEIICVEIRRDEHDAFNAAIEAMLPELDAFELEPDVRKTNTEDDLNKLCEGGDIVRSLVAAYDAELAGMYQAYRDIVKMNVQLLKELGVTKASILEGLRTKIVGLKDKYWGVLFGHFDQISKKLATKQRKDFLESLTGKAVIDFTEANIYAMLIWIGKCASEHFDDQLVEVFKSLAQKATVERYKSNEKVFGEGRWRYLNEDETHYRLCYRMVLETHGGINTSDYSWDAHNGLKNSTHELLGDWITVANNLGFACSDSTYNHHWESNRKVEIYLDDGELLLDVRAFKNGNIHMRPNKKVMLAINVQAGKLLGWLRTPQEAVTELDAEDDSEFVQEMFARSNALTFSNVLAIGFDGPSDEDAVDDAPSAEIQPCLF